MDYRTLLAAVLGIGLGVVLQGVAPVLAGICFGGVAFAVL